MYHQPLRLSVVIQAPLQRVTDIMSRNQHLKDLLDNEWIYLMVMDPTANNAIKKYNKNMDWMSISQIINEEVALTYEIEQDQLMEVMD